MDTQAQRLLAFSWSFWVLIVIAAYTANLASFFVTQNLVSGQVATITDAVRLGKSICVVSDSVIEADIRTQFSLARLVYGETTQQMFQNLKNGECDLIATALGRWNLERKNRAVNLKCDLSWNGIIQLPGSAGISLSGTSFCYASIGEVVDFHMKGMVVDGTLDRLIDKYESVDFNVCSVRLYRGFEARCSRNELASPSPSARYIDRFATHSCPNEDEDKITASSWAGSSATSVVPTGGTESLRFLIFMLLYPNEGRSMPFT